MAAPQLRLEVSLNLTGFRGEIQKLTNIAQSEFAPKINVKFNRRTLDTELNNLQAAIKRRVYRIEIGGNIDKLPGKIQSLKEQLASLEDTKIDVGVGAVKSLSPRDARRIKTDLRTTILDGARKILIPVTVTPSIVGKDVTNFKRVAKKQLSGIFVGTSIKPSILKKDVTDFTNAVKSKLSGITVSVKAELETASIRGGAKSRSDIEADVLKGLERISEIGAARMSDGGGVTESARREQLKQRLSTGEFDIGQLRALSEQLGVKGGGRFKNTQSLIERIVAEASVEMIKKYLDPQAVMRNPDRSGLGKVLDTFARGIFNMLGMDPASIRAQQQASKPKPFTPAGLLPAAYRGIGPSAEPAGLLPPAYRGIGPSAEPAGLLPSLSSAGRSKAITEALIASTGPRLLPSGGGDNSLGKLAAPRQTKDAVDAILRNYFKVEEAQVREVFSAPPIKKESLNIFDHLDTEQYFNYLAQARVNAENAIKQSIEEAKQVTRRNQIKDAAQSFLRALEETVRNAERSVFVQSRIAANQSYVQKANIREIGQPLLGGKQAVAPKMLSAATGFYRGAAVPPPLPETQAQLFARREREARMRSALRGVDVMGETPTRAPARYSYANRPAMPRRPTSAIVPYEAGGALVPSGGGGAVPPTPPRGGGGGGSFGGMQFNVPNLPGAGLVREIGTEFGFAAKQVLLFGTAYKALAFIQGFPAQVGEAVGALQSFRNTIGEISPSAQEAAESSQFILDIVEKYNTPLQSARDGFVKLYASMQPAGFSGDEIRDLFLGISQTAATFGMSADKVDRVNYAFAQMASKGQVMSEELKGQLGDVLPGAMAIFAKAAGFKGPEAIAKFSKALEDGAYKGGAMKVLLTNVGSIMRKEFGPGAEGAALTFQGVMNRMQNSAKLLYEAFEPVAVGFLNSVVIPLTSGLKTITDGFNAFFTGVNTKTAGGFAFAQELEKLRPTFEGIRANVTALLPTLQSFANTLLNVSKVFLQIVGNPFVGYLSRVYLNVLALTTAINILNLRALIPMIANFVRSAYSLVVFTAQCIRASIATRSFGMAASVAGLMLRTFFATTGLGLILVGIGLLIERFTSMNQALANTKEKALGAAQAIRSMSQTEARTEGQSRSRNVRDLKSLELAKGEETGNKKQGMVVRISEDMAKRFEASGIPVNRDIARGAYMEKTAIAGFRLREEGLVAESESRQRALNYDEQQSQRQADIAPIPPSAEEDKDKKKTSLESYYNLQDQLAKAQTQADIERLEAAFEHARAMINAEYDLKEAKANSFQKKAIAFQKEIFAITSEQDAALFKNRNKILAAAGSVAGGAPTSSGGSLAGMTQYITGDPSHPSYKPDHGTIANYHDHLAFASREAAIKAYEKLTKSGIQVTEFQGFGKGVTVPHSGPGSAHHKGLAMDVPGAQWGGSGAIGAREFAGSARVRATLGMGGGTSVAPGKVAPSIKRDELAEQQVALAAREMNASAVEKEAEAIAKLEIATANYVQSLLPTAEQSLQNQLLQQRITLTQNSFSPEILEAQLAFAEQELQVAESIKLNTERINELTAAGSKDVKGIKALTDANNQLKANLPVSAIQLLTKAIDNQVLSLVQRTKTAKRDAADQERVNSLIIGGMTRQAAEAKVTAENLRSDYKKALEEATKQVEIAAAAEEVLAAARRLGKKETAEQTAEYNRLAQALKDAKDKKDKLENRAPEVEGAATGIESSVAPKTTSSYIADGLSAAQEKLDQLTNTGYQVVQAANSIGNAFGEAFKGVITGSMTAREALAGFFQSVADHFADMVAQMIAEYLKMALIKGIMAIVGGFTGGAATTSAGSLEGATGDFFLPMPGDILPAANGAVWKGGFQAFADGGIVTGPTLGLVGEGRYNEAVIPLPDGKSVPVDLGGAMGSQITSNIVVNVSSDGKTSSSGAGSDSAGLGRKIEGAVKQVIVGELRPGGLLAGRR